MDKSYQGLICCHLECYRDFTDVFLEEAFTHLPPHKAWDHAIDLHHNAKLPRGRTFPLSLAEQKELDEFLRENLANRHICPSKSLIGAPVFFVKKKEGSLHLVQDYQKLNAIKNSYPLPLVSDMLTRLCDAEWFTTLDLCWGFNNVCLKEGDEWKAAFLSGRIQDWEHMQHLGTCRALTYLQGVTQGEWVPAEGLSRSGIIMYKSKYIHRGLYLSRSEKKAAFSSYSSPALYNGWVMWRKELNKKAVTHY